MFRALLRGLFTALRGSVPCRVALCGRSTRAYGYCGKHLDLYRYVGRDA